MTLGKAHQHTESSKTELQLYTVSHMILMKIEIQPPALNTSPTDGNYTSALQLIHLLNTANATTGRKEADLNVKNKK